MQFFEAGVLFILFLDKMRLWNHLAGKAISLCCHRTGPEILDGNGQGRCLFLH